MNVTVPFLKSLLGTTSQECIDFPFAISSNGYGDMIMNGIRESAHRCMCRLAHGEPPKDKPYALHNCKNNKKCINPNHLRWGTQLENTHEYYVDLL